MARCTEAEEVRRSTPRKAGFSLVELVVVVVIIGVLASLGIPRTRTAVARARATTLVNDVRAVRRAALDYFVDHNAWPAASEPGQVPAGLEEYLPEGFTFESSGARLNFVNDAATGASDWGEEVGLGVSIEDDPKLQEALARILEADRTSDAGGEGGLTVWVAEEEDGSEARPGSRNHGGGGIAGTGSGARPGGGSVDGGPGGASLEIPSLMRDAVSRR